VNLALCAHFSRALIVVIFIFGLLTASTIMAGDELGRVNLIHYVLFFCLFPLFSLILLLVGAVSTSPKHFYLTNCLIALPLWPRSWVAALAQLKQQQLFAPWLRFVSQALGLAFSLGCLTAFLFVLLFSDIAFVWRSTLLSAEQIYPVLKAIAWPWQIVDSAQPLKALLVQTQELRFGANANHNVDYGRWWAFLLMAQIVYAVMPRLVTTGIAAFKLRSAMINQTRAHNQPAPLINKTPAKPILEPIRTNLPTLDNYNVVCWLSLDTKMLGQAIERFPVPKNIYQAGFHGEDEQTAIDDNTTQLVLVAAWEPPLGELKDFLAHGHGVIMPLDFNQAQWQSIAPHYLDEWRRFTQSLDGWQLYVDKELV